VKFCITEWGLSRLLAAKLTPARSCHMPQASLAFLIPSSSHSLAQDWISCAMWTQTVQQFKWFKWLAVPLSRGISQQQQPSVYLEGRPPVRNFSVSKVEPHHTAVAVATLGPRLLSLLLGCQAAALTHKVNSFSRPVLALLRLQDSWRPAVQALCQPIQPVCMPAVAAR
jgi:hypothetical protein